MVHHGSCLCGAVTLQVDGDIPAPDACHCTACRKTSGHYFVSTDVKRAALTVIGAEQVSWYQSSEKVRRGFCRICGSTLFWDPPAHIDWIGVAMGVFDGPSGTQMHIHIYVSEKGDYYQITDGLPQADTTPQ
ncbi:GFA family protein [Actibacterium sp. 188UL27-1]|uniref:GFA family protein n=1 Tax=Actibacterium sp. 188UL27-1 TaxID=2786961 RepID=UPI00195CB9B4|nr:GFA family protein [Actibacterium sp. 188UL27-1]MBM7066507.1 GFA family protein [Actibacterium sp. 188UL27-1]